MSTNIAPAALEATRNKINANFLVGARHSSTTPEGFIERDLCCVAGCRNLVTASVYTSWKPDAEWKVCESCHWTLDPNAAIVAPDMNKSVPPTVKGKLLESLAVPACRKTGLKIQMESDPKKGSKMCVANSDASSQHSLSVFEKVLSLRKITESRIKRCDTCDLHACCAWIVCVEDENRKREKKRAYVCLDCQEKRFGGWPRAENLIGKAYMDTQKIKVITSKCSRKANPYVPPAKLVGYDH